MTSPRAPKHFIRNRAAIKQTQSLLHTMSDFEDTIDDVENRFLANPEDLSLASGIIIELDNLIEQVHDEINHRRSIALKNTVKQQFDN